MSTSRHDYTTDPESVGRILARLAEADPVARSSRPNLAAWRLYRPVMFGLAVVIGAWAVSMLVELAVSGWGQMFAFGNGDLNGYLAGTRQFLATGSPYDQNLGGRLLPHSFIHPPSALILFAPFLVLPAFLWWAIPILGTIYLVGKPAPWTWPLIALVLAWPRSQGAILAGNSDLWAMFFVALGMRYRWPFVLLIVKPTFGFLGILGLRDRRTWIALAVLAAAMLPFLGLWTEWIGVVRQIDMGLGYSLSNLPLVLIGLVRSLPTAPRGCSR